MAKVINPGVEAGAIHIRLPFKSMDDVSFSGAYAPLADELVSTLREHLGKADPAEDDAATNTQDDPGEDAPDTENPLLHHLQ